MASEWKLVPVEPTDEMLDRVCPVAYSLETRGPQQDAEKVKIAQDHHAPQREAMRSIYKAMLAAAPDVKGEPVAEPRKKDSVLFHLAEILRKAQGRTCDETGDELDVGYECMRIRDLCKAAPPAPDVSALVEALERINGMDSMSYHSLESAKIVARAALDAYRKRG